LISSFAPVQKTIELAFIVFATTELAFLVCAMIEFAFLVCATIELSSFIQFSGRLNLISSFALVFLVCAGSNNPL
jgi:hypothetical protein